MSRNRRVYAVAVVQRADGLHQIEFYRDDLRRRVAKHADRCRDYRRFTEASGRRVGKLMSRRFPFARSMEVVVLPDPARTRISVRFRRAPHERIAAEGR